MLRVNQSKQEKLESANLYEVKRTFFGITESIAVSNTLKVYANTKKADALARAIDNRFDEEFQTPFLEQLESDKLIKFYDTSLINEKDYSSFLTDALLSFVQQTGIEPSDTKYKIFIDVSDYIYVNLLKMNHIEYSSTKFMGVSITRDFIRYAQDKVMIAAIPLNKIKSSDYIPRYISELLND